MKFYLLIYDPSASIIALVSCRNAGNYHFTLWIRHDFHSLVLLGNLKPLLDLISGADSFILIHRTQFGPLPPKTPCPEHPTHPPTQLVHSTGSNFPRCSSSLIPWGLRACNIPGVEGGWAIKSDCVSTAPVQPPGGPRPAQAASVKKASEGRGAEGPMAFASRKHRVGRGSPALIGTGEAGMSGSGTGVRQR